MPRNYNIVARYSNKQSFPLSHYESPTTIVASGQSGVTVPVMDIDVGGVSLRNATAQTLSVNSDTSWDFGQDIGTWTANTVYSVGDWVRTANTITAPTDISNCALWLDAGQGVTYDGSSLVSQWNDMSGNERHATQSTSGYKPLYVSSAQGNKPTLRFDGSDDHLLLGDIMDDIFSATGAQFTIFFIVKKGSLSSTRNIINKIGDSNFSENERSWSLTVNNSLLLAATWYSTASSSPYRQILTSFNKDEYAVLSMTYDGSLSGSDGISRVNFAKNGLSSKLAAFYSNGTLGNINNSNARLCIGAQVGVAGSPMFCFDGDISEIIIFGKKLNRLEHGFLTDYLSEKYNIDVQHTLPNYKCTSPGTSLSSEPTWGTTVGGTTAESGGPTWTCYYDYTSATNRAGTDFYVYACQPSSGTTPTLLLSANSTYPHGYTASNSRKIGGFHGLCGSVGTISGHTLTGYLTGDVLPQSVWCLKHRAKASSNVGLVYIPPLKLWAAIYLTSGTSSAPTIVFGGTILDTITYFVANDAARALKMRMPRDSEFAVLASGSNEGTNILGGADPVTVTAAVDTAGRRMISNYGVESATGSMYQWLSESLYRFGNTTSADTGYTAVPHTHNVTVTGDAGSFTSGNASADVAPGWNWKNKTGGKGQLYTQGTYGITSVGAGGYWGNSGVNNGSQNRSFDGWIWASSSAVGFRLITSTIEK